MSLQKEVFQTQREKNPEDASLDAASAHIAPLDAESARIAKMERYEKGEADEDVEKAKWERAIENAVENEKITHGILRRASALLGKEPWQVVRDYKRIFSDELSRRVKDLERIERRAAKTPRDVAVREILYALTEQDAAEFAANIFLKQPPSIGRQEEVSMFDEADEKRKAIEKAFMAVGTGDGYMLPEPNQRSVPSPHGASFPDGIKTVYTYSSVLLRKDFYTMLHSLAAECPEIFTDGEGEEVSSVILQKKILSLAKNISQRFGPAFEREQGIYYSGTITDKERKVRAIDIAYANDLSARLTTAIERHHREKERGERKEAEEIHNLLMEFNKAYLAYKEMPSDLPPAKAFFYDNFNWYREEFRRLRDRRLTGEKTVRELAEELFKYKNFCRAHGINEKDPAYMFKIGSIAAAEAVKMVDRTLLEEKLEEVRSSLPVKVSSQAEPRQRKGARTAIEQK